MTNSVVKPRWNTKLGEGDEAILAIAGFGQSSLTAAKKKLRALGYELPEAPAAA